MDWLLKHLDTAEFASAFWLTGFLCWALTYRPVRKSIPGVLAAACQRQLLIPTFLLAGYMTGVVWLGHRWDLWTLSLLKGTILWFVLAGPIVAFTLALRSSKEGILRVVFRRSIEAILILQFLIASYTFSLPVEMVLVPVLAILGAMDAIGATKEDCAPAKKVTETLLSLIGLAIILTAGFRAVSSIGEMEYSNTARKFLLGPCLSIVAVPFIQGPAIFAGFEELFDCPQR